MEAKLEIIKYNEHEIKKWAAEDGFVCYDGGDIFKILNAQRCRGAIDGWRDDVLVTKEDRIKYSIVTYKTDGRRDNTKKLLTERGLKKLLCINRSITAINLAKIISIDMYSYKYFIKEPEFINAIIQSFPGEEYQLQYTPENTNYHIDLYFPKRNLAVECDENHHTRNQTNISNDLKRQIKITEILNCEWIRFCPDDTNFNIFKTIGEIYSIIKK
jgi:hypothetical protein